jgi:hypothetical protein
MIVLRKRRVQPPIIQTYSGKCVGISETVSGTIDGNNQIFYTSNDYEPGSINLLYNGQVLHSPGDFIESGDNKVTLIYIYPDNTDVLRVLYEYKDCSLIDAKGRQALTYGTYSQYVAFASPFLNTNYIITTSITNEIDAESSIYPLVVRSKTVNGFTVNFSGRIDSDNYVLEWFATAL